MARGPEDGVEKPVDVDWMLMCVAGVCLGLVLFEQFQIEIPNDQLLIVLNNLKISILLQIISARYS